MAIDTLRICVRVEHLPCCSPDGGGHVQATCLVVSSWNICPIAHQLTPGHTECVSVRNSCSLLVPSLSSWLWTCSRSDVCVEHLSSRSLAGCEQAEGMCQCQRVCYLPPPPPNKLALDFWRYASVWCHWKLVTWHTSWLVYLLFL